MALDEIIREAALISGVSKQQQASAKLQQLSADFFKEYLKLEPGQATYLGVPGNDDYLPAYGAEANDKEKALKADTLDALKHISRRALSKEEKFDYDLFKQWLAEPPKTNDPNHKWRNEDDAYKTTPSLYGSGNADIVFAHVIYPSDSPETDLGHVTSRLMQFPRQVEDGKKNLTHDAPSLWVKNEIERLPASIDFLKTLTEFYKPVTDNNPDLKQKLEAGVQTAVSSLQDYQKFLQEKLLPVADGPFAVGPKMFAYKLKHNFFIKESPAQLQAWAQQQSAITRQKIEKLADQIEPGKTPDEVLKNMEKEHPALDHLMEAYRFDTARARKFIIDHDLLTMPKQDNVDVIQTPAFLAHQFPSAAYFAPKPFANNSKGTFVATIPGAATPADELDEMLGAHNVYSMRNTIVHEAYPGHHIQLSLAREVKESPLRKFLNNVVQSDIKVEGWGLYSEQLMEEQGFVSDPKDQLMRLKWLLHRQLRVLIGIGLHTGKLTRDQAVEKFTASEPGLPKRVAEGEVDYFTELPLQPLSYALGHRQLLNLRSKLHDELGKDFSLKAFHDAVLNTGNLPLGLVEKQIERDAIDRSRKQPQEQAS